MAVPNIDLAMWQKFLEFQAFQAATKSQEVEVACSSDRVQSLTTGQPTNPMDPHKERNTSSEACNQSSTSGRPPKAVCSSQNSRTASPSPEPNARSRSKDGTQDPVDPDSDGSSSPAHGTTPSAFARQDTRNANPSQAGPSKDRRSSTPPPTTEGPKSIHPYDKCSTSYEKRPKQRGGRVKIKVNGKEEIARTPIERLIHRKAKYKHVCKEGHLFGDKYGCYFNPYSKSRMNEKTCKRIEKPGGFQVGRGGDKAKPWFELIGLRNDYDYAMDIRGSARTALIMYRPQSLTLKSGQKLTYKHYGSTVRTKINNYMYAKYPFLFHFRDESGDDSWAIDAICTGYLASNGSYTKAGKNPQALLFLKRNVPALNSEQDQVNEEGEDDNDGYEDDYALNFRHHSQTTQTASKSRSLASRSSTGKRPHPDYDNPRPMKKQVVSSYDEELEDREDGGLSIFVPTQPSAAEIRKADRVVAQEEARDNALGASRNKVGAKPATAPKGKGKESKDSPAISKLNKSRRKQVVSDGDSDDDGFDFDKDKASSFIYFIYLPNVQTTLLISKKIQRKDTLSSSEGEPELKMASKVKTAKKGNKKDLPKNGKRKESPPPLEEEPEQWKPSRRPKPKQPETKQGGKEVERTLSDEEEFEPLPAPLVSRNLSHKLVTVNSECEQNGREVENGQDFRAQLQPEEPRACSSKRTIHITTEANTQELFEPHGAKPVGTIKIRAPVPPSSRELRSRT